MARGLAPWAVGKKKKRKKKKEVITARVVDIQILSLKIGELCNGVKQRRTVLVF